MYREGHVGTALLFYVPVGLLAAVLASIEIAAIGSFVAVGLSTLSDIDELLPGIEHRGITHTVHFALVVGVLIGFIAAVSGPASGIETGGQTAIGLGLFGFVVGTVTILSHIAADALTPMGVDPLASGQRYSLGVVKARNPTANYALLTLGLGTTLLTAGLAASLGVL